MKQVIPLLLIVIVITVVAVSGCTSQSPSADEDPIQANQTTSSKNTQEKIIAISYNSSLINNVSYKISNYPYVEKPENGKVFLKIDMSIQNNGYDKFGTSPYFFKLAVNSISYD